MAQPGEIGTSRGSYFTQHWRGELSLTQSFWANGLGITFGFNVLLGGLWRESLFFWFCVAALILFLVAIVWQPVGIWRSAGKSTSRAGRILARIGLFVLLLWNLLLALATFAKLAGG